MSDNEARNKLMLILENDIEAMGWDVPSRMYVVSPSEDGDEYLEFIGEIDGHPIDFIRSLDATYGQSVRRVIGAGKITGFILATEGWTYPADDMPSKDLSPEELNQRYRELPPAAHPRRVEIRQVTFFAADGFTGVVTRKRDGEPEILHMKGSLGGMVVNVMRDFMGISENSVG